MSPREVARCGLSVALLAVASSVSLAIGPVPFTLQTLVLAMLPIALGGRTAVISVAVWVVLGAVGLPVFSGFSGGLSHIVGPTGGFIWGFLIGMVLAAAILRISAILEHAREVLAVLVMLLVSYALGTLQAMVILNLDLVATLSVTVLPFVVPDAIKLVLGVSAGRVVRRAMGLRGSGVSA